MPTIAVPFAFAPPTAIEHSTFTSLHHIMHMHPENLASGLVLIALLTYFYTAFSKLFQPGGGEDQQHQQQTSDKQALKLESRIYYSSPAAV